MNILTTRFDMLVEKINNNTIDPKVKKLLMKDLKVDVLEIKRGNLVIKSDKLFSNIIGINTYLDLLNPYKINLNNFQIWRLPHVKQTAILDMADRIICIIYNLDEEFDYNYWYSEELFEKPLIITFNSLISDVCNAWRYQPVAKPCLSQELFDIIYNNNIVTIGYMIANKEFIKSLYDTDGNPNKKEHDREFTAFVTEIEKVIESPLNDATLDKELIKMMKFQ